MNTNHHTWFRSVHRCSAPAVATSRTSPSSSSPRNGSGAHSLPFSRSRMRRIIKHYENHIDRARILLKKRNYTASTAQDRTIFVDNFDRFQD